MRSKSWRIGGGRKNATAVTTVEPNRKGCCGELNDQGSAGAMEEEEEDERQGKKEQQEEPVSSKGRFVSSLWGAVLGSSCGRLGRSWRPLGPSWGRLGPSRRFPGGLLGRLGAIFGASCGALERREAEKVRTPSIRVTVAEF